MEITTLKQEHIPAVTELLTKGTPYVLPHHDYVYWIMKEYYPSSNYIAVADNKVIGFICALPSIDKKCYFIWQIVVDAGYRGKKVATLLVNRIIEEAKLKGLNRLELTISHSNEVSYKLFASIADDHNSCLKKIGEYNSKDWTENAYFIEL